MTVSCALLVYRKNRRFSHVSSAGLESSAESSILRTRALSELRMPLGIFVTAMKLRPLLGVHSLAVEDFIPFLAAEHIVAHRNGVA